MDTDCRSGTRPPDPWRPQRSPVKWRPQRSPVVGGSGRLLAWSTFRAMPTTEATRFRVLDDTSARRWTSLRPRRGTSPPSSPSTRPPCGTSPSRPEADLDEAMALAPWSRRLLESRPASATVAAWIAGLIAFLTYMEQRQPVEFDQLTHPLHRQPAASPAHTPAAPPTGGPQLRPRMPTMSHESLLARRLEPDRPGGSHLVLDVPGKHS